ncbi:hypothetical protein GCM10009837_31090 [Streptomyces durmitorensis]
MITGGVAGAGRDIGGDVGGGIGGDVGAVMGSGSSVGAVMWGYLRAPKLVFARAAVASVAARFTQKGGEVPIRLRGRGWLCWVGRARLK